MVYIGSWDSKTYALDQKDGSLKWSFQAGTDPEKNNQVGFQSSPCVAGKVLYTGCRDSHCYALDALTGAKIWEQKWGTAWVSNTAAFDGSTVFIGTNPFKAFDATTGKQKFVFNGRSGVFSSPALTGGDTLYFGSLIGSLFAIDAKTGTQLWEFKTDAAKADRLKVIGPEGTWDQAAFATTFGDFEEDYITMFKRFSVGSVISSPLVDGGEIFFGSADGNLYALKG